jgi:hypothetical protein
VRAGCSRPLLVPAQKPDPVRLLPGWPVSQSWLQLLLVVVVTLSWAWMTRPAPPKAAGEER